MSSVIRVVKRGSRPGTSSSGRGLYSTASSYGTSGKRKGRGKDKKPRKRRSKR